MRIVKEGLWILCMSRLLVMCGLWLLVTGGCSSRRILWMTCVVIRRMCPRPLLVRLASSLTA
nr:MAG TPA: hypothetical protein [Caudoviricetes sp.]